MGMIIKCDYCEEQFNDDNSVVFLDRRRNIFYQFCSKECKEYWFYENELLL